MVNDDIAIQNNSTRQVESFMAKDKTIKEKNEQQICVILPSDEQLTGRAGLSVFAMYLRNIALFPIIDRLFGTVRENDKGLAVTEMFVQILSLFMDGTSRHMSWFDHLAADNAYVGLLGTGRLASSHAIKRFIGAISFCRIYLFRRLLQDVFLWRLKHTKPDVIVLGIDTTALDNDDAEKRYGVQPTYKKVKWFQPLQMNWGRYVVDAVFRGGKKHSNHGNTVNEMLVCMARKIRKEYCEEVPIIVRMDAGFFDDEVFKICEQLNIGYLCGGKQYRNVIDEATKAVDWLAFKKAETDSISWMYTEFMSRQKSWHKERRTLFSTLREEDGQYVLQGICRDSVIITNPGLGEEIDEQLSKVGREEWLESGKLLGLYHHRGTDELANHALKTFGHEQLPFKRFTANSAWYYLMVLGNNLFEAFKEEVTESVIPVSAHADTFRRRFIDTAGKLVRHVGKLIMKVNKLDYVRLKFDLLVEKCKVGLPQLC